MVTEKVLWVRSNDTSRGVGILPSYLVRLGYDVATFDELKLRPLIDYELIVFVMSAEMDSIKKAVEELHLRNPNRQYKVLLWMPDRNVPKSVEQFFAEIEPESFDGIGHAAGLNRAKWEKLFPTKQHIFIETPNVTSPRIKEQPNEASVMSSGAFTKFKGLGNLLKSSPLTANHPTISFAYTGCPYAVSQKTGKPIGSPELMSCLVDDFSSKNLHANTRLMSYDDWDARKPGEFSVFPPYSDRVENQTKIANAGVFLFTPLATLTEAERKLTGLRKRQLDKWNSALDYNLLEAMETGTICLISNDYYSRIIEPLEDFAYETYEKQAFWPIVRYDTLEEAFNLAEQIIESEDYSELSKAQAEYLVFLTAATNAKVDASLSDFIAAV